MELYNVNCTVYESDRDPSLTCGDNTHSVISPASAPCVIGVGATAYRTHYTNIRGETVTYDTGTGGAVGDYSSRGPTLDGRVKPEVVAPGTNIISAYSSYHLETLDELPDEVVATFEHDGRRYGWISGSGTSMSSPAVAGAIALWLQANPQLSPDGVREVLKASSTRRGGAQGDLDCEQGYGEINVYKGLLHILGIDGLPGISDHQPDKAAVSVADGHVVYTTIGDGPAQSICGSGLIDIAAFMDGHVDYKDLGVFAEVTAEVCAKYGIEFWSNLETFDRDMPWRFPPIEFTKLEYKLKAVQPYASKVITFEAPHFLSSLSMFPSARNLLRCYRKKHEQELNVLSR